MVSKEEYNGEQSANVEPQRSNDLLEETKIYQTDSEEEVTLRVNPSSETDKVIIETNNDLHGRFSKLEGNSLKFVDFYRDARTFLEKANSTKFMVVAFILITSPLLLMSGNLTELVYREIIIIIALTYLGVDVYEKRSLVRKK